MGMTPRRELAAALAGAVLMALSACKPAAVEPASGRGELQSLVARCTEAMVRDVCVARRQSANASPAASQVFVAGVGAIDAKAYAEIRASGEAMCGLVQKRCGENWDGGACVAARSLWPTNTLTKVSSAR
jgi:hypothetical protein